MKVSLKWLKDYIDVSLPPADVANKLTMAGIEVKATQIIGGRWENIVIGQLVAINPHPNADRLVLTTIDLGTEQQTVVTGAPNLRLGDKVVFARVGAELIHEHTRERFRLKPAKIRGVLSEGMICSERELGISDSHEGILVLPEEAPVGAPLADYLGDTIFDLEVTPNRPDCLSVLGIARELSALTRQSLRCPETDYEERGVPIEGQVSVDIAAPDLCPRYCASLIKGVKIADSPRWLQQRLLACGMRPINNVVDVTNYVMLEYGQPLHAFDYDRIKGKKIIVRRANSGETLVSLDGVERVLSGGMLVIADAERSVAIAGIMGGANSEVTERTTSVLLEAANFDSASIHTTSRKLSLITDASTRFERGICPELTLPAIKRATRMIIQLAGGEAAEGVIDVYPGKQDRKPVLLSTDDIKRILGIELGVDRVVEVLTSLGFDCKPADSASQIRVSAPFWRSDIHQAVDLVEEVARIVGYDAIPTTMLSGSLPSQNPEPIIGFKRKLRDNLTSYGFYEVITYSVTSLELLKRLLPEPRAVDPMPLRVANPMTVEQEYLRPNLRAGLLAALSSNRRHEDGGIRLFELGRVYLPQPDGLPNESEVLCGILSGPRQEEWWQGDGGLFDFFDVKGVVESLLGRLGVEAGFEESSDESLHPSKQAAVVIAGTRVGIVGEVHPKVSQAFEISGTVYLFEIELGALLPLTTGHRMFQPIPRFPAVVRDIALVIGVEIPHRKVLDVIKSSPLVRDVTLFDVYTGGQVPPGKKSLAYRLVFQSPTHTLTDEEVNRVQQQIIDELSRRLGATLRS